MRPRSREDGDDDLIGRVGGVAISNPQARDGIGTTVERTDEALYRAKREGRNRVAE